MKKLEQAHIQRVSTTILYFIVGALVGLSILVSLARILWHSKYYPGVKVAEIALGGLTQDQARLKVSSAVADYHLKLAYNEVVWEVPQELVKVDVEGSLQA